MASRNKLVPPALLLMAFAALAVGSDDAPAPKPAEPVFDAVGTFTEDLAVARVTGNDVNVRAGPSVDYPSLATLPREALVVVVEQEGDWKRVRIPGGVEVFVFAKLVEHDGEALTGRVLGDDVLMRGSGTRARLPVHEQRLQRDQRVLVLGKAESDDGEWLRVLSPRKMHVWMHSRYLEEVGRTAELRPKLRKVALARVDGLTGGRTLAIREAQAKTARQKFEERLDVFRAVLSSGAVTDEQLAKLEKAQGEAPDAASRAAAQDLLERMRRAREQRRVRTARDKAGADAKRLADAKREAEERRKRYEREMKELDDPTPATRPAPDAEGTIKVEKGKALLVLGAGKTIALDSRKFRLADYAGKRVRLWGTRSSGDVKLLRVDHLEVMSE